MLNRRRSGTLSIEWSKGNAAGQAGDQLLIARRKFHRLGTRSDRFFRQDFFERKIKI
jgi:hypothetical protein